MKNLILISIFILLKFSLIKCETNSQYLNSRIINGNLSEINQFPYITRISLYIFGEKRKFCTGTLIATNWILTAAHCLINVTLAEIIFGHNSESPHKSVNASHKHFRIHNKFTGKNGYLNDIALIQIPKVKLSNSIQIIKLPRISDKNPSFNDKIVTVIGWGKTKYEYRNILHYTEMKVISREYCETFHKANKKQICAMNNFSTVCDGDSGGALIIKTINNSTMQLGIISLMVYEDCKITGPTICTRISRYMNWIQRNTGISF